MHPRQFAQVLLGLTAWLALVGFSALIVRNSVGYFTELEQMPFVEERSPVSDSLLWRAMLVAHVAGSIVCSVAVVLQFFRGVLRRWPALHRWLGRAYVHGMLWVAAPSGLYLAYYAKGGVPGQIGFSLLGVWSLITTWIGWRAMVAGRAPEHVRWMIRSFAMATSAITFRLYHVTFAYADWAYETNYLTSIWLSVLGNAALAELVISFLPSSTKPQRTNLTHETALAPALIDRAG